MSAAERNEPVNALAVSFDTIRNLARSLGAVPGEFIPCAPGAKRPLVRGFDRPTFLTNWDRVLAAGPRALNVAMLFGRQNRFIGIDCDTPQAVDLLADCLPHSPYVHTRRGTLFLAKCEDEVSRVTSSAFLRFRVGNADSGELRLQRAFSILHGRHPSGANYELHPCSDRPVPVVDLHDLVRRLRERVIMPDLAPPSQTGDVREASTAADGAFWAAQARYFAECAPARPNGTAGTDQFVVEMTTGLRTRPHLAPLVVSSFSEACTSRGLSIRGGHERLLTELQGRLARWANSYGGRARHCPLRAYLQQRETEQDTVLLRFVGGLRVRADQMRTLRLVGKAFLLRAALTGNEWRYEASTALAADGISPPTFVRSVGTLVRAGLLEREKNTLPSTRPQHLTAAWMYRLTPRALKEISR